MRKEFTVLDNSRLFPYLTMIISTDRQKLNDIVYCTGKFVPTSKNSHTTLCVLTDFFFTFYIYPNGYFSFL